MFYLIQNKVAMKCVKQIEPPNRSMMGKLYFSDIINYLKRVKIRNWRVYIQYRKLWQKVVEKPKHSADEIKEESTLHSNYSYSFLVFK